MGQWLELGYLLKCRKLAYAWKIGGHEEVNAYIDQLQEDDSRLPVELQNTPPDVSEWPETPTDLWGLVTHPHHHWLHQGMCGIQEKAGAERRIALINNKLEGLCTMMDQLNDAATYSPMSRLPEYTARLVASFENMPAAEKEKWKFTPVASAVDNRPLSVQREDLVTTVWAHSVGVLPQEWLAMTLHQ